MNALSLMSALTIRFQLLFTGFDCVFVKGCEGLISVLPLSKILESTSAQIVSELFPFCIQCLPKVWSSSHASIDHLPELF